MNILVTGIHGFVGSNLVVALKERHSLYGLDIVAPEKEGVVKTFSWKDIEPASFPMRNLPEFDAIIHLAGKAHDTKNRSAAQAYFDINMGLTQKIFDFFLESSAKKFVFFSSVKAAADSVVGDVFTTRLGQGGSGLGLHIVHNIVGGVLGGEIKVSSEPGQGAEFSVALPLLAPQHALG